MKLNFLILAIILLLSSCAKDKPLDPAAAHPSEFTGTYGGPGDEYAQAMLRLDDGSIVMLGATDSEGSGSYDVFLLKTDAQGNELWRRTYGGADEDRGYAIAREADGGFAIAGTTKSFGAGSTDAYLLRVDSEGNLLWQKTYGASGDDLAWGMASVPGGGYMLAGITDSYGFGGQDIYLVRTDAAGNMINYRAWGGAQDDGGVSICRGYNNSCMVLGGTNSFGSGSTDLYVMEVNYDCDTLWTRTYGTPEYEEPHCIAQTFDGNILITGHTAGMGDINHDLYAIKITPAGNIAWAQNYGEPASHDGGQYGIPCDGGFIMAGRAHHSMSEDVYVVRTNASGAKEWEKYFGGHLADDALAICEAPGAYYVSGYTTSSSSGRDVYLIRINK